jgi:uncharacterized protein (DUF433 family)
MRIGYKEYKLKIKTQQIPVPVIPDNHKQCSTCMEYKHITDFYLSHAKNPVKTCKSCYKKYHRDKVDEKISMNGGSSSYYAEPNKYFDEEQKKNVFMVMEALGWIFDEPTGIWNKPGIKENGVFVNMVLENKPKKIYSRPHGRKIKSGVWNNTYKIVKLIEEGYTYDDVAEVFDCSHTLIRTVITQYRNEKKSY